MVPQQKGGSSEELGHLDEKKNHERTMSRGTTKITKSNLKQVQLVVQVLSYQQLPQESCNRATTRCERLSIGLSKLTEDFAPVLP